MKDNLPGRRESGSQTQAPRMIEEGLRELAWKETELTRRREGGPASWNWPTNCAGDDNESEMHCETVADCRLDLHLRLVETPQNLRYSANNED